VRPPLLATADGIVKDLGRRGSVELPRQWWVLPLLVLATGPIYGAFMGSYSVATLDRWLLVVYAAVKVPLLIFVTTAVCLPGFFVLNTVLGLRNDFGRAMRAIFAGQAAMTVALASLGPITKVAYMSGLTHRGALLFNAAMFTVATAVAQLIMFRRYRELIVSPETGPRHRLMLWMWVVLYVFVGMQMGWMLRPFVGSPGLGVSFFREEPFTNAYVVILRLVFGG
jgi:hypothetical protein